jgi:hypothetical protein
MKNDNINEDLESHRVAWFTGLSIALGILVNRIFFLLAGIVLLMVPVRRLARYLGELEERALSHRHI